MLTKENSFSIYHNLSISASVDVVFEAITKPENLISWWPLRCTGIPREDEVYNFYFTPEYDWYGKVIKLVKNQSFHIKMTKSNSDWGPTSFGFDLQQIDNSILVSFWHIGWPKCNSHYKRSSYCWALLLNGLKEYIEKGIVIPFEERS